MAKVKAVKITFDTYRKNARRSSNNWATSDRGWMHVNEICYGHYLDYGGLQGYPPVYVHAVMFDRLYHSYYASSVHHRVQVFQSVKEAQAWMKEEITNNVGHMKEVK